MEQFGYKREQADILRTAHLWYPEESLFKEIPIQVKYNRARMGDLKEGSVIRNLRLLDLSNDKMDFLVKEKPQSGGLFGWRKKMKQKESNGMTVVMAGSYS